MNTSFHHLLITLRNSQKVKRLFVIQKSNKTCERFLNILWDEGFISGYRFFDNNNSKVKIFLSYFKGIPAIKTIRLVSRPSRILSYSAYQLWKIDSSVSVYLISTNEGLRSLDYCKRNGLGGVLLFSIS
jgi:small subunit ribosomal protein S8